MKRLIALFLLLIGMLDLTTNLTSNLSSIDENNFSSDSGISNIISLTSSFEVKALNKENSNCEQKSKDCHECLHQCHLGHCQFSPSVLIQDEIVLIERSLPNSRFPENHFLKSHLIALETPPPEYT